MKIDYKKLTGFESALIVMIVAGLLIVGLEIYSGLPQPAQVSIKDAVAVLDMKDSVKNELQTWMDMSDTMLGVYAQINSAFIETVAISDEWNQLSEISTRTYSVAMAMLDGGIKTSTAIAGNFEGSVLGTSIDSEQSACGDAMEVSMLEIEMETSAPIQTTFYELPKLPQMQNILLKFLIN